VDDARAAVARQLERVGEQLATQTTHVISDPIVYRRELGFGLVRHFHHVEGGVDVALAHDGGRVLQVPDDGTGHGRALVLVEGEPPHRLAFARAQRRPGRPALGVVIVGGILVVVIVVRRDGLVAAALSRRRRRPRRRRRRGRYGRGGVRRRGLDGQVQRRRRAAPGQRVQRGHIVVGVEEAEARCC